MQSMTLLQAILLRVAIHSLNDAALQYVYHIEKRHSYSLRHTGT
jgi:hypothetical protein